MVSGEHRPYPEFSEGISLVAADATPEGNRGVDGTISEDKLSCGR